MKFFLVLVLLLLNCLSYSESTGKEVNSKKYTQSMGLVLSYQVYDKNNFFDMPVNFSFIILNFTLENELNLLYSNILNTKKTSEIKLNTPSLEQQMYMNFKIHSELSSASILFKSFFSGLTLTFFPLEIPYDTEIEVYIQTTKKKSKKYTHRINSSYWLGVIPFFWGVRQDTKTIRGEIILQILENVLLQIENNEPEFLFKK
jgi:hypothetical protein